MTETETRPVTQPGADPFRSRLLLGMAESIRISGYRECTVADVVRLARTSRRTFYEHFASKDDCFIALLDESLQDQIRQIEAAVVPTDPWPDQVRQAIGCWIATSTADPSLMLSWVRDLPGLPDARALQRAALGNFGDLVRRLTDTPELRAVGIEPVPRTRAVMLLGGLRELIAVTVEDGDDVADIVEESVQATIALLAPLADPAR